MEVLANTMFTPPNQDGVDNPKKYEIKALTSLEFMRVMADGSDLIKTLKGMKSSDIETLLSVGLVNPSDIERMTASQMVNVANAILEKAVLAEEERKNL